MAKVTLRNEWQKYSHRCHECHKSYIPKENSKFKGFCSWDCKCSELTARLIRYEQTIEDLENENSSMLKELKTLRNVTT